MKTITDLGEDGLIAKIKNGFPPANGVVGIGDDCAVYPAEGELSWLVTTDALVEGCHFLENGISPEDLAYKAVAINLSDIASMGGKVCHILSTLCLNGGTKLTWIDAFIQSFADTCKAFNVQLIGGDTTRSLGSSMFSVTAIGHAVTKNVKYRHTAQAGDVLAVTRAIGGSHIGLTQLLADNKASTAFTKMHTRPCPQVEEGQWLGQYKEVHAMMDISDGLGVDLPRMLKSSGVGAKIDVDKLPMPAGMTDYCNETGMDPYSTAVSSGEEYALLVTIAGDSFSEIAQGFEKQFNTPLHAIGRIENGAGEVIYLENNQTTEIKITSYEHF